jgi:hypothetical protein
MAFKMLSVWYVLKLPYRYCLSTNKKANLFRGTSFSLIISEKIILQVGEKSFLKIKYIP